jgi:hypothetical protein
MTVDIEAAFVSFAEAIRARGSVPEDVIVNLEMLRASMTRWLAGSSGGLCAPEHGRWVITPSGAHVELGRRPTLRRLIGALVEARVDRPGVPLAGSELIAAGWPDEPAAYEASANRLRVALCRLRQLGLETVIVTTSAGWLIHPDVPVTREGSAPVEPDGARVESRRCSESGFFGGVADAKRVDAA